MTFIIALLISPFILLTLCFAIEVFLGLKPLPLLPLRSGGAPSAVIVVPAHNEESVLGANLEQLKISATGQARILLVADNCNDRTAQIGRDLGVEVVERNEPERKGKGFALDFAKSYLDSNRAEVILVVDADCLVDRASVLNLIQVCAATGRPCQATYLLQPSPAASPVVELSTFAFFIRNVIRQRALNRLAGRTHLLGTGMAFPWSIFAGAELATSSIVEDLKLGQELADSGQPPVFVEQATVWGRSESDVNTISQRRRWEGGFLQNAKSVGLTMLGKALACADLRLVWAAIDLMIPPFALLILLDVLALLIGASLSWLGSAHQWPIFCLLGALICALAALALAWMNGGSRFASLRSLAQAPLYVAWKLPMYIGLALSGAPKEWIRTDR